MKVEKAIIELDEMKTAIEIKARHDLSARKSESKLTSRYEVANRTANSFKPSLGKTLESPFLNNMGQTAVSF